VKFQLKCKAEQTEDAAAGFCNACVLCFTKDRSVFWVIRPYHSISYMQPVVTDTVAWSVSWCLCHDCQSCKNGWTIRDAIWCVDSGMSKEPCIRWRSGSSMWRGNL